MTTFLSLIALSFITLTISAPTNWKSRTKPSLKAPDSKFYASDTSQVQLFKDVAGFYVNIDLDTDLSEASDSVSNPDKAQMMLGLYSSQTLLTNTGCLQFSLYNCTEYNCSDYSDSISVDSPYFNGTGHSAAADVYLAYKDWILKSNASMADSCSSNSILPYGRLRHGIIGMGLENGSSENFLVAKKFSVTLSNDLLSGHLNFGTELTQSGSTLQVANFTADKNWHIAAQDCNIQIANASFSANTSIIFDLNADQIGLPLDIFTKTMQSLMEMAPMNCSSQTLQPVCLYSGDINSLPTINISTQNNNITIAPTVYVQAMQDTYIKSSTITLNLKALSPNLTDESYVTEAYSNYIILDSHVMSGYFIVFDGTNTIPTIALLNGTEFQNDGFWIEVMVGAIVFLSVVFCCCFCSFDKKASKKIHATEDEETDEISPNKRLLESLRKKREIAEKDNSPATAVFWTQDPQLQDIVGSDLADDKPNAQYIRMNDISFHENQEQCVEDMER